MYSTPGCIWRMNTSFTGNLSEAQLKLEQREFLMNKLQKQWVKEKINNGKILEVWKHMEKW